MNNEQDSNTILDTTNEKQEQSNQNKPPTPENRNTTQPNNTEQTITPEKK